MGITKEDMDHVGLGEEERKALEGAEDEERLDARQLEDAERDDDDDGNKGDGSTTDPNDKGGDKTNTTGQDDDAAKKAEEQARQQEQQQAAGAERTEPLVTTYHADPVPDYDEKVKAIDTRIAEAEVKFKAGEITFDEFRKQEREALAERRQLDEQRLKAEISQEQTEQAAKARWQWECDNFMRQTAKTEGIDYKASPRLWAALDAEVRRLGGLEENKDKPGVWFLEQAHAAVKADFGLGKQAAPSDGGEDPKAEEERKRREAIEREKKDREAGRGDPVPRTLGGLPPASSDDDKSEFAHLDKLEGMDLERALARMSKEDADRYLMGA